MEITINTDGSCIKKRGVGGFCCIVKNGKNRIGTIRGGLYNNRHKNNNSMELTAVIESLMMLSKMKNSNQMTITIYSDSSYVVDGYNIWLNEWIKNKWLKDDGKPIQNLELWENLSKLIYMFNDTKIVWIKRNSNNTCIECDRTARSMARTANREKRDFKNHTLPKEI